MNTILEELNEEQRKPVEDTEGAVLVLAGAGSGKTRVLTSRIAYLIQEKGVSPSQILAITFTNKAAKEMKERIDRVTESGGMWVSTIHSMCVRILRQNAEKIGFTDKFSIYTETERANVVKQSFKECDFDEEKLLKNIKYHISNAKMLGLSPEEYTLYTERRGERSSDTEKIEKVYARYMQHLKENNAMDFDDLLVYCDKLLKEDEEACNFYSSRFRYILVDEFQDTNGVQFDIIRRLACVHGNLFAVGDDDQSIYGWRGADIDNILHFERTFPAAKVYKLERNYRSTKTVLDLANTVIHNNRKRKDKTLWTENPAGNRAVCFEAENETEEAVYTARVIAEQVRLGASFSDFAVLMRINALTRSYEQEFTKYGIPFKVFGGFRFFERKEIKDLLAYLRVASNPFDSEAVVRIINFPRRGIGERTVEILQEYAAQTELTVYDALLDADELPVNGGTRAKLQAFAALLKDLVIQGQALSVDKLVGYLVEKTNMREAYADNSEESVTKRANIDEFQNAVDEFVRLNPDATLDEYLNQIALSSDSDEMDDENYVTLATIHAVKGLEFNAVFVCGLEENVMPTSRAQDNPEGMEEERRLMYVAITRARERIYFTRSKSRYLYGRREPTARSQFLKELAAKLDLEEETSVYKRYEGDYYGSSYSYGSSYGRKSGYAASTSYGGYGKGYGTGGGYSDRYGYKKDEDEGWHTYGGSAAKGRPMPAAKSAPRAMGAPTPALTEHDESVYSEGVRVSHPKFGEGVVLARRGGTGNVILTVRFQSAGVKELSARLAPLKVLE